MYTRFSLVSLVTLAILLSSTASASQTQKPTDPPTTTASAPRNGAGTTRASADTSADYRLAPGDKLRIEVYKDPQLSQSLQIRPDGKITLPLVGDVPAAGVSAQELTRTLTERLKEYLNAPVVTVIVAEAKPPTIYVLGEVNNPGAHEMSSPITILQALALAGGFKDFANPKKIQIQRKRPDGGIQTIHFNYKDAIARPARPLMLQPGDTIIVP